MIRDRVGALRLILVWVLLEAVAAAQVRRDGEAVLTTWLRSAVRPVVATAEAIDRAARAVAEGLRDRRELAGEVARLRSELARARIRTALLEEDRAALEEALEVALALPDLDAGYVVARCTWRDLGQGLMEVSAGRLEGVRPDVVAVSADGVVGRVVRVSQHSSWVELVTRPTAAVAVRTVDGEVEGLAVGTGGVSLRIDYLPRRVELLRGTELLTTGADGVYPPGLRVARVVRVREGPEAFLDVVAEPTVDLPATRVVALVLGWPGGGPGR